jgi:uncharacterized protein YbbK (DUF523 family)
MEKILVSACLMGNKVRYNGDCLSIEYADIEWLNRCCEIVCFCPEVASGLPTPRAPAEIVGGVGREVLAGTATVLGNDGIDVTDFFLTGAQLTLDFCLNHGVKYAILAESSPSCGSQAVYDGTFSGTKVPGRGVTVELLESNGITVFSQHNIASLRDALDYDASRSANRF